MDVRLAAHIGPDVHMGFLTKVRRTHLEFPHIDPPRSMCCLVRGSVRFPHGRARHLGNQKQDLAIASLAILFWNLKKEHSKGILSSEADIPLKPDGVWGFHAFRGGCGHFCVKLRDTAST